MTTNTRGSIFCCLPHSEVLSSQTLTVCRAVCSVSVGRAISVVGEHLGRYGARCRNILLCARHSNCLVWCHGYK